MPRQLLERDIHQEARRVRDVDRWPHWPYLPIKNINTTERGLPKAAILCDNSSLDGPVTIRIGNIFELHERKLADMPTETFPSIEEMIRAGWIGD